MLTRVTPPGTGGDEHAGDGALQVLDNVGGWLAEALADAAQRRDTPALLRHARDRALLLMLFWRPVSAAELTGLRVEDLALDARRGLSCTLPGENGPRAVSWTPIERAPLKHLCPLRAVRLWLELAAIERGPLFPRIEADGALARQALPADSVLGLLLELVERCDAPADGKPADATDGFQISAPHATRRVIAPDLRPGAPWRARVRRSASGGAPRPSGGAR